MLFGLKNIRVAYQWLINKVFENQIWKNLEVSVNDMVAKTTAEDNHYLDLTKIFQ